MKKIALSLLSLTLILSLLACQKTEKTTTQGSESVIASDTLETTATEKISESVETRETPEIKEAVFEPLFDTACFPETSTPDVVDGEKFERLENFDNGNYAFNQSIIIPKIDSDLPGAIALNAKMAEKDLETIKTLQSNPAPSHYLYNISYTYSTYNGIIAIQKHGYIGLYQSEGYSYGEFYYYDSVNDRELSGEEYIAHFGLDIESLNEIARWCDGYVYAESYFDGLLYSPELLSQDESLYSEEVFDSGISYALSKGENTPKGFKVTEDFVSVYYSINGYVTYTEECKIDVKTGLPDAPMFFVKCNPTGVLEGKTGIKITLENGLPTEVLVSKDIPLAENIEISNSYIQITYTLEDNFAARASDSHVEVNGYSEETQGYSQGLAGDGDESKFVHTYHYHKLMKLDEFETVEIVFDTDENLIKGYAIDESVSWANWSDDPLITDLSLNKEALSQDQSRHLPIYKCDSLDELNEFKETFSNVFTFDGAWDEVASFEEVSSKFTEDFFKGNDLLLVYVEEVSCTPRFGIHSIKKEDGTATVNVQYTYISESYDDAMAGWLFEVPVSKDFTGDCTNFDAVLM